MIKTTKLQQLLSTEKDILTRKKMFYKIIQREDFNWDLTWLNQTTPTIIPYVRPFKSIDQARSFLSQAFHKFCQSMFWIEYKALRYKKLSPDDFAITNSALMYYADIAYHYTTPNDKYHELYKRYAKYGFKN